MTLRVDPPARPARLARDARCVPPCAAGRVVVVGNLDGVHRGHREVLSRAASRLAPGQELAVLTFEPHPAAVLGASPPATLTRLSRKVELLAQCGVGIVVAQTFDAAFAALSPASFVDQVLVRGLDARRVVIGHDFRFGARRAGDVAVLRALAVQGDSDASSARFEVEEQQVVGDARGAFSSTRIRAALAQGDLDDAREVLGRPHAIEGVVVQGDRRGRTLGFPTANLGEIEEALPAHGVYAVVCDRGTSRAPRLEAFARGVANIGTRPTIAGARPSVEVHLFDLDPSKSDLYGDVLRVHLVARLREERRFSGLDALRAQITVDADRARALTSELPLPAFAGWF